MFDENRAISVNNQKLCSKSTFLQNRGFEEKAHTECILVGHSDVNERVYPYVHDENARFSIISFKMILFKKVVTEYCSKLHFMYVCYSRILFKSAPESPKLRVSFDKKHLICIKNPKL